VLLLAAQLVDVAWAAFILLGIERFHLDPSLPSNPLVLDHMPYTHSLVATVGWAALAGVAVAATVRGDAVRAAVATALVVCSHWALDVIVHRPDMTVLGPEPRLGLALWNRPVLAFVVEIACLVGAAAYAATRPHVGAEARRAVARGVAVLVVLHTFSVLGPVQPSLTAMVLSVLTTFAAVAWAAARAERRVTARA
jgi:hypothetical protein